MNKKLENIFKNYTKKEKNLILILISLILILVNYKYYLSNRIIEYNLLTEDVSILESEINRVNLIGENEYDLSEFEKYDYKNINLDRIFKLISLSEKDSFQIESLEMYRKLESSDVDSIIKENLNIIAKGDSVSIISFIDILEKNLELASVENIRIYNNNELLKLEMNLSIYSIDYEFNYKSSENIAINNDPFNELGRNNLEFIELDVEETANLNINIEDKNLNIISNDSYYKEKKDRLIDFEYIQLEDSFDYNDTLEIIESTNKSLETDFYNRIILNEKFLEIVYKIKNRKDQNNLNLKFKDESIDINEISKISFSSDEKNKISVDFILKNKLEDKIYSTEIELERNWVDYEFELIEKGFYLTGIFIHLDKSKDMGVINVKIK